MTGRDQSVFPGDFVTVAEVAKAYRVSKMTIYRLINTGELKSDRVGRSFRIRATDVVALFSKFEGSNGLPDEKEVNEATDLSRNPGAGQPASPHSL